MENVTNDKVAMETVAMESVASDNVCNTLKSNIVACSLYECIFQSRDHARHQSQKYRTSACDVSNCQYL